MLKLQVQYLGHLLGRADSLEKTLIQIEEKRRKEGIAENEAIGQRQRLYGHEFEQILGDGGGQGSLARYSPWGHKELCMTQ